VGRGAASARTLSPRALILVTLGSGLTAALLLVSLGAWLLPSSRRPDIWFEVAKAGVQLGVVVILGGVVAAALRYLDATREDRRRLQEYRLGVFHDLLAAYTRIKAARRTLRAFGFRATVDAGLDADQVAEYRAQMRLLLHSQLSLEKVRRELATRPDLFRDTSLRDSISGPEKYVHSLVNEWEEKGVMITDGADAGRLGTLSELQAFLGPADQTFRENLSRPMEDVQAAMRSEL